MEKHKRGMQENQGPKTCRQKHGQGYRHRGRGPSSFWMHDPDLVFDELKIRQGERVLDLGCGAGDYALKAAESAGESGLVYALDHWPPTVDAVKGLADAMELSNLEPIVGNVMKTLPIKDNDIDVCLIFTVLHIFNLPKQGQAIYKEVSRVLKPGGRLAVIECKKEEMPFGPPVHMRLSPKEVELSVKDFGYEKTGYTDLGYNYLIQFTLNR